MTSNCNQAYVQQTYKNYPLALKHSGFYPSKCHHAEIRAAQHISYIILLTDIFKKRLWMRSLSSLPSHHQLEIRFQREQGNPCLKAWD
ncbi:MAG: hypothetical protein IGS49_03250 [Chlorogloeopsis fritschii C42_A2020_084]|uniref:hypothetical protein n=1 Tax=Chlorogloeopsis fritschii TaxID=1124 RepID=UPI001A017678|nr:hypothetical protein [Chlorogloeopsis fritschii]MBF2004497.1 hypothetical protein [Chlorogloeopsis fritschii C42_A2020_084]